MGEKLPSVVYGSWTSCSDTEVRGVRCHTELRLSDWTVACRPWLDWSDGFARATGLHTRALLLNSRQSPPPPSFFFVLSLSLFPCLVVMLHAATSRSLLNFRQLFPTPWIIPANIDYYYLNRTISDPMVGKNHSLGLSFSFSGLFPIFTL